MSGISQEPAVGDEVILSPADLQRREPGATGWAWVGDGHPAPRECQSRSCDAGVKQGEVDAAGIQASNPFQLAVTGGTGRFQNARGQATIKLLPGKGNRARVTLSLLP